MRKVFLFSLWFFLLSAPLSYMTGAHTLSVNPVETNKFLELLGVDLGDQRWEKLHFLASDCGCSEKVYESLINRFPSSIINEHVFVLGTKEEWVTKLKAKGYAVILGDMDEYYEKYSLNAVPQLVILDSQKEILYAGGYSAQRNLSSAIEDQLIIQELQEKRMEKTRPIFGCLVGDKNRKLVDPLGLKY